MLSLIFTLLASVMRILCVMFGWNWFVAHPFNLPELGFWHSYALMLVSQTFTFHPMRYMLANPEGLSNKRWSITNFTVWTVALGLLWIVHYFLPL